MKKLLFENCSVVEISKNKAIVETEDKQKIVARVDKSIKAKDKVDIYQAPFISRIYEALLYMSPILLLLLGFGLGFLFKNAAYHYFLLLGTTILGMFALFIAAYLLKKQPSTKYIAVHKVKQHNNETVEETI